MESMNVAEPDRIFNLIAGCALQGESTGKADSQISGEGNGKPKSQMTLAANFKARCQDMVA